MQLLNETLQWIALLVVGFLLLGLYRHIAIGGSSQPEDLQRTTGPALGKKLPDLAGDELDRLGFEGGFLIFVSEGCAGCQRLLSSLENNRSALDRSVVLALKPSDAFARTLDAAGIRWIPDQGEIWRACQIAVTPFIVEVNSRHTVTRKDVEHDADALASAS